MPRKSALVEKSPPRPAGRPSGRTRVSVTLTIDKELWARCRSYSGRVNWSRAAEQMFLSVMNTIDALESHEVQSKSDAEQKEFAREHISGIVAKGLE